MNELEQQQPTVGIIGGAGEMGQVVARYFRELGYTTLVCDPKQADAISLPELLDRCTFLYLSVFPLESAAEIMHTIASHPNARNFVVLENGTIKAVLEQGLDALDKAGASICATHPMCRADQPWKNQNVLLIPHGSHSDQALDLGRALYQQAQMNIKEITSITEHDEMMALLQLIPHLTLRVVSTLFDKLGVDLDLLNSSATANFKLFYMSFWRVQAQSPELSAAIIWRLLQQDKGQQISRLLKDHLELVTHMDSEAMANTFEEFYQQSGLSQHHIEQMNRQCVVTLERLANLDRRAITITATSDEVGILRRILAPFDELGLNINAIDSHLGENNTISFEIGTDEASQDTLEQLRERIATMGHSFKLSSD